MKAVFVFLITFVLIGGAGWLFWRQTQDINNLAANLATLTGSHTPAPIAKNAPAGTTDPSRVVTFPDGLKVEDLLIGPGLEVRAGDLISVHYIGTLADGKKFDSSYDRNEPLVTILGAGKAIKGWDQGISGMKIGGKRRLIIPPDLAYGEKGFENLIPPNATITFEIELLDARSATTAGAK